MIWEEYDTRQQPGNAYIAGLADQDISIAGTSLSVTGTTDHFYLVNYNDVRGWVEKKVM